MSWTQNWRAVGNIGGRPHLKVVEALDGSGRRAIVRTPKLADANDFSDRNNGKHGVRSEIFALQRLNEAGVSVPTLYESQADGDWPYAVVEFIPGEALFVRLRYGVSLTTDDVTRIAAELRSIVDAAHKLDVYHRDLHGSNVMLRPDGRVVVIDWSMAECGQEHRDLAATDDAKLEDMLAILLPK